MAIAVAPYGGRRVQVAICMHVQVKAPLPLPASTADSSGRGDPAPSCAVWQWYQLAVRSPKDIGPSQCSYRSHLKAAHLALLGRGVLVSHHALVTCARRFCSSIMRFGQRMRLSNTSLRNERCENWASRPAVVCTWSRGDFSFAVRCSRFRIKTKVTLHINIVQHHGLLRTKPAVNTQNTQLTALALHSLRKGRHGSASQLRSWLWSSCGHR